MIYTTLSEMTAIPVVLACKAFDTHVQVLFCEVFIFNTMNLKVYKVYSKPKKEVYSLRIKAVRALAKFFCFHKKKAEICTSPICDLIIFISCKILTSQKAVLLA